jgi:SsrA-binding protein
MAKKDENKNYKVIAENRRARFDYAIESDLEVGIVLQGSEVKSRDRARSMLIAQLVQALKWLRPRCGWPWVSLPQD